MAPRRDVRHAAWRTAPAVACGRRAWRRTRHLATKAARQSRGQTFLQACAALEPGTAQDRHRSVAQLSGGKSGDPGTCKREARVRQSGRPTEQPRREQPPTNARTRASHARLSRPETHTEISLVLRADQATLRAQRHLLRASLYRKQLAARFVAWRELTEVTQNPSYAF